MNARDGTAFLRHSSLSISLFSTSALPTSAVILAAGKSTRMKSALPKPLHEVCGRPMLGYLLDAAFDAGADRVVVVVGHGKEQVIDAFRGDERIVFVEQKEQLGTGHAVQVTTDELPDEGDVIVLAGDLPLIRGASLIELLQQHRQHDAALSLATAKLPNPFGYGRVVRDGDGGFSHIVEELDATPEQRQIREVFPSVTCGNVAAMKDALGKLSNDNAKGEYYFTDIFHLAREAGGLVQAVPCVGAGDIVAPNDRHQLAEAGRVMQERIQAAVMAEGVGIVDPRTTWIEHGVVVGRDSQILPFSHVGRGSRIGHSCTIGPFATVVRNGIVPDGDIVAGNARQSLQPLEGTLS